MNNSRYIFHFKSLNIYEIVEASSALEARHKLFNSDLAPYYHDAVLLSNEKPNLPCERKSNLGFT